MPFIKIVPSPTICWLQQQFWLSSCVHTLRLWAGFSQCGCQVAYIQSIDFVPACLMEFSSLLKTHIVWENNLFLVIFSSPGKKCIFAPLQVYCSIHPCILLKIYIHPFTIVFFLQKGYISFSSEHKSWLYVLVSFSPYTKLHGCLPFIQTRWRLWNPHLFPVVS